MRLASRASSRRSQTDPLGVFRRVSEASGSHSVAQPCPARTRCSDRGRAITHRGMHYRFGSTGPMRRRPEPRLRAEGAPATASAPRLRASGAPATTSAPRLRASGALLPPGCSSFVGRCRAPPSVARRSDSGRTSPHDRDHRSFARKEHVRRRDKRSFARKEHLGRRGERSFARQERSFHPDAPRSSADAALLPASYVVPTAEGARPTTEIIAPSRGRSASDDQTSAPSGVRSTSDDEESAPSRGRRAPSTRMQLVRRPRQRSSQRRSPFRQRKELGARPCAGRRRAEGPLGTASRALPTTEGVTPIAGESARSTLPRSPRRVRPARRAAARGHEGRRP